MGPDAHKALPATTNCSTCHESARPLTRTMTHNFDHSRFEWLGQDCATCHTNKNDWGVTWTTGQFAHSPQPGSCIECHENQMPRAQILVGQDPLRPYLHTAGGECVTCHYSTSKFDSLTDFRPAAFEPSGLVGSKAFTINVVTPTFNGTTMVRSNPVAKSFKLEVDHGQDQVGSLACATCHTTAGTFSAALFHRNISLNPNSCNECHVNARPVGAVGAKGFMRHEAVSWVSNVIGTVNRGTTAVVGAECATCHLNTSSMPQAGMNPVTGSKPFSGSSFHLNMPAAGLSSCLDCHAHSRPTNSANFTDLTWKGKTNTGAPPFTTFDLSRHATNVDCATCHIAPGVAATTAANWAPGYFRHTSANLNCVSCHTSAGVTSTSHVGFNSNCVTCHAGAVGQFPNPVIADWKVNVVSGAPTGVVGEKTVASATTCVPVLGSVPICSSAPVNTIAKGYDHAVNTNNVSCQNCHGPTAASSANGKFHVAPVGAAGWVAPSPTDLANCNRCHDPTPPPATVASIKTVGIVGSQINLNTGTTPFAGVYHGHAQIAGQQCATCHSAPSPNVPSVWTSATKIHSRFTSTQLATCSECHNKRMPSGLINRKNQLAYKGTHQPQKFTHTNLLSLPTVASQQCSNCHSSSNLSWTAAGTVNFHSRTTVTASCNTCHVSPTGTVTSQTSGVAFDHGAPGTVGDCASCHQASLPRVVARTPQAIDWDGGTAAPRTYTIPSHKTAGLTVAGFTGTHSANANCSACHGTGNYKVITDFDHQGLPAGQNSCVSCHLGAKADVAIYIASTSGISMKTAGDRHHPTSIFNGKNTSCVGCHTTARGANTFTNANGVVYPTNARQAYVAVGCGSVNGTTFACHESNQRIMTVPVTTGTLGKWK